ncbi:MAG: PQQ-dependent sugar dehydrogenase [Anaerolineae bacterium]|nr:PQQ-dependent sugar dehydrogenase [Anaerolineae bacterium]
MFTFGENMRKIGILLIFLLTLTVAVNAQDEPITSLDTAPNPGDYELEEIVTGLTNPIYVTSADDGSGRLFVLEQPGRIWLVKDNSLVSTPFLDISNVVSQAILNGYSEQGLLGLAFHPDYAENGIFFVHYSDRSGGTVIARYQVSADNPDQADASSEEILFTHEQPFPNHNGGEIAFGPDGYLYVALGDGGSAGDPQNNAQNTSVLLGKILRIDVSGEGDYSIPEDNPANTVNSELAPEIWAFGLRNPWRFSFDRATGDLYIADVGQNQWEEVNFQPADSAGGENYGWRPLEATHQYSGEPAPADAVPPIAEYDHSMGCSISGGYVYRGETLTGLQGVYLFGDWCSGRIWASYRDSAGTWQTIEFMETGRTISSFGEDEQGELYILDYYGGNLLRLTSGS